MLVSCSAFWLRNVILMPFLFDLFVHTKSENAIVMPHTNIMLCNHCSCKFIRSHKYLGIRFTKKKMALKEEKRFVLLTSFNE